MSPEKKEKIASLRRKLANLTDQEQKAIIERQIVLSVQGKAISEKNTILLYVQSDLIGSAPSVIGGYRQWQAQGRQVKKGEHALSIWAPAKAKKDPNKQPDEISLKDVEDKQSFFLVPVFDISQTEEVKAELQTA